MKVLLKSLEELKKEYGIERLGGYLIIDSNIVDSDMIEFLGKIVESEYDKKSDSYVVDGWYFNPNFIKGVVTGYNIKNLSDGKEYTLSF